MVALVYCNRPVNINITMADTNRSIETCATEERASNVLTGKNEVCSMHEKPQSSSDVLGTIRFRSKTTRTKDGQSEIKIQKRKERLRSNDRQRMKESSSRERRRKEAARPPTEDVHDIFGRYIAYKLRAMDKHSFVVQKVIYDVIFNAEMECVSKTKKKRY